MTKKDSIHNTAVKLIAVNGFHETTIKEIVDTASVSVGSFYNYFSSKEDLLKFIFTNFINNTSEIFTRINNQSLNSTDKLELSMIYAFEYLQSNPCVCKVIADNLFYIFSDQDSYIEVVSKWEAINAIIIENIKDGINKGEIKNYNTNYICEALFSIVFYAYASSTPLEQNLFVMKLIIDSIKI